MRAAGVELRGERGQRRRRAVPVVERRLQRRRDRRRAREPVAVAPDDDQRAVPRAIAQRRQPHAGSLVAPRRRRGLRRLFFSGGGKPVLRAGAARSVQSTHAPHVTALARAGARVVRAAVPRPPARAASLRNRSPSGVDRCRGREPFRSTWDARRDLLRSVRPGFSPASGSTRLFRHRWLAGPYWTPVQMGGYSAGATNGKDWTFLAGAQTEVGGILRIGDQVLEVGLGAGVGMLSHPLWRNQHVPAGARRHRLDGLLLSCATCFARRDAHARAGAPRRDSAVAAAGEHRVSRF